MGSVLKFTAIRAAFLAGTYFADSAFYDARRRHVPSIDFSLTSDEILDVFPMSFMLSLLLFFLEKLAELS